MARRKWKETKQKPSLLPGPALPGCSLVSSHILWAILCPQPVQECFCHHKSAANAAKIAILPPHLMSETTREGKRRGGKGTDSHPAWKIAWREALNCAILESRAKSYLDFKRHIFSPLIQLYRASLKGLIRVARIELEYSVIG